MKIIATNKSASFEYFIEEKYEAGIVLEGNENYYAKRVTCIECVGIATEILDEILSDLNI